MASINEYFQLDEEESWLVHPRVRHWRLLQRQGARLNMEVRRQQEGLGRGTATIYVQIKEPNGPLQLEHEEWSYELHIGLVKLGVKAASDANEAIRFGLAFVNAFEFAESRVGNGFFNSVLIDSLQHGPLAEPLAGALAQVHVLKVNKDSRSYDDCSAQILGAIQGRARELTRDLAYPETQANAILAAALECYLDDRFSISERKRLGFT